MSLSYSNNGESSLINVKRKFVVLGNKLYVKINKVDILIKKKLFSCLNGFCSENSIFLRKYLFELTACVAVVADDKDLVLSVYFILDIVLIFVYAFIRQHHVGHVREIRYKHRAYTCFADKS